MAEPRHHSFMARCNLGRSSLPEVLRSEAIRLIRLMADTNYTLFYTAEVYDTFKA